MNKNIFLYHNNQRKDEIMNENIELLEYIYKDASMAAFTLEELLKDLNAIIKSLNHVKIF